MAKQNIYDNETFYEGYKRIRDNKNNANNLFEIPALLSLLPDLKDKRILDLGCGFGEHCKMFVEDGAASVVGIDISEKMLEVAKRENSDDRITYLNMAMEDIGQLDMEFDLVVSSLAFHYVEDFSGVVTRIFQMVGTLFFRRRIHCALAIAVEIDGRKTRTAISSILFFQIMVLRAKGSLYGL